MLGLLYPMHVYWLYLIVKMALRMFVSEQHGDVRSDNDDDDDDDDDNDGKEREKRD